jgi:4-hydroxybutyrate dehydrogenase
LLATHAGPLAVYRVEVGGSARITAGIAPVIAVPTTAGTGSEIGRGMGLTLAEGAAKGVFISPHLVPKAAICDPELTLTMPRWLTAGSGVDALCHCIEAYLSPAINPPADAVALDGVRRLVTHLPRAVRDGADKDARWEVMMGALEGGMTTWKGLGTAHALSIPLDTLDLHHGTVVGVLMPFSVGFQMPSVSDQKMARLAEALGCGVDAIFSRLVGFNAEIGLPKSLSELGVAETMIPAIADEAVGTSFNQNSARRASAGDFSSLLQEALR